MIKIAAKVFKLTSQIPEGKVSTYGLIAEAMGNKNLSRAVGRSLRSNPDPITIPCHRVVNSDGRLGGYKGSSPSIEKATLLRSEGIFITTNYRIPKSNWNDILFHSFSP